jgi:hypothetical protein
MSNGTEQVIENISRFPFFIALQMGVNVGDKSGE